MDRLTNVHYRRTRRYADLTLYTLPLELSGDVSNSAVVDAQRNLYCGNCRSREGDGWHCKQCGMYVCMQCLPVTRICKDCGDLG